MVARQHYRWDFIGLSTDTKPTPSTSEKVVDGSTFYCSDNSKLYVWYKTQWYEKTVSGGGGGTSDFDDLTNRPMYNGVAMTSETNIPEVITYTAGSNIAINDGEISATDTTYTAGDNISITNGVISATDTTYTAGSNITITDGEISATDTTYSNFTGTDGTAAGTAGLVPAPATTDAGKFLKADGTWDTAGGSSVNVVQTPGTSTTDVMSQNAVTSMVFADPQTQRKIKIGAGASSTEGIDSIEIGKNTTVTGNYSVALGGSAIANSTYAISLGNASGDAYSGYEGSVSIGRDSHARANGAIALGITSGYTGMATGEMHIGASNTTYGYNSSNYRLLSGLYDPQSAHDAATKGYVDPTTDSSAPTTATVGRLGQIFIDTTAGDAYMCVVVDTVTPAYTWKKITP